jgi:MFS family permease
LTPSEAFLNAAETRLSSRAQRAEQHSREPSSTTGNIVMRSPDSKPYLSQGGLCLLLAGQFLPQIDFSIVNVALESISRSLGATEMQLELIVAVYSVAFAVCLAMGGRLGDNFGRRRLFGVGLAVFTLASLLCGVAGSIWMLLAARALQGVGAALAMPQIIATFHVTLHGHGHSRALGLYAAINGLALVIGQVLGGYLVSADIAGLGWRTIFLINLPIGIVVLALARHLIPETRALNAAHVDKPGTLLLALVIGSLLMPLALGPVLHWPVYCFAILAGVLPLLWALVHVELWQEKRGRLPLLPPSLFRLSSVRFAFLFAMLFSSSFGGFMFTMALTLQIGAGASPLQSGNSFVAMGTGFFLGSLTTARAFARWKRTSVLLFGSAVQMTGLLVMMLTLHLTWPHSTALALVPAMLLIGPGQAFMFGSYFRIGLSEVPVDLAGAGAAMLSTLQQTSFGLGPALFGAVFAQSLHFSGNNYLTAALVSLALEIVMMTLLVIVAVLQSKHPDVHHVAQNSAAVEDEVVPEL